jgi:hypothetical protein
MRLLIRFHIEQNSRHHGDRHKQKGAPHILFQQGPLLHFVQEGGPAIGKQDGMWAEQSQIGFCKQTALYRRTRLAAWLRNFIT